MIRTFKTALASLALASSLLLAGSIVADAAAVNDVVHAGPGGAPIGFIVADGAPNSSITGSTSETVLAYIKIPGGTLGRNSNIQVDTLWNFTGTAGTKTRKIYLNSSAAAAGTAYLNNAGAAGDLSSYMTTAIYNNNSVSAQIGGLTTGSHGQSTAAALPTGTINTANDCYIVITATLANAADSAVLAAYDVTINP